MYCVRYLLLWMYCLENKVLTFVLYKNYSERELSMRINHNHFDYTLSTLWVQVHNTNHRSTSPQVTADIIQHIFRSSLPFSSKSSLSWKRFVSERSTQEIKQMIYWQLFCVHLFIHSTKVQCSHFSSVFPLS